MELSEAIKSARETKVYDAGNGAVSRLPGTYLEIFGRAPAIIVADENTFSAAGLAVQSSLERAGIEIAKVVCYPRAPQLHAEYEHIERLRETLRGVTGTPVAVGGGTVNDIVKRAAWELERRYACVATAASVDGYTSFGAAIVKDGFKQTMECDAPTISVGDTEVLANAPVPMNASGYGDLCAKLLSGADWLLADELGISPLHPLAWRMVQEDLRNWVAHPDGVPRRDAATIEALFGGLAMTGFAMQAIRDSRPASGAEHLLSHVWEMEGLSQNGAPVSHGFKVAVGTLGVCALFEHFLSFDVAALDVERRVRDWLPWSERRAQIEKRVGNKPYLPAMIEQSQKKYVDADALRERLERLKARWTPLCQRLREQIHGYEELRNMLSAAGCPTSPEAIGLSRDHAVATFELSQMMRARYTVLDIAFEMGLLDAWAEKIGGSGTFWR